MLPLLILSALLPLTNAQAQVVQVGYSRLQFFPDTVFAQPGQQIEFDFIGPNHNVAAGSYSNACAPSSDSAFYSGVLEVGKKFTITVNNTDPIWIYCSVRGHCQNGMVGVINPPSSGDTLAGYRSAAAASSGSSSPANVAGGVIADSSNASSSVSTPSGTASITGSATAVATSTSGGNMVKGSALIGAVGAIAVALMTIVG